MQTKTFPEIVADFKSDIDRFLKANNYNRHCIQVILKEDRPAGPVMNLQGNVLHDIAVFDDAKFILCVPL